jgi:predicted ATP-grasp superfamily ATP-dependent carboligase
VEIEQLPELDRPNVIAAFSGWNDAGQAATTAVRYLIETWHAQRFAHIDPEEYYSFTDTRPTIRIMEGAQRQLTWPANDFFFYEGTDTQPAAVLMVGVEPNLKWRSYCGEIVRLAKSLGARRLVTVGSLITDTVHTRAVPLTGFSTDDAVQGKFSSRGIARSSYEGPTGIVGVLHDACNRAELPAASLWAASPFYLGSTPNPKTALGLLDALDEALALRLNLSELRGVADEFVRQVSLAVRDNEEVQERIRNLEERADAAQPGEAPPEFPSTGAIIADLENFLRKQRDDGEPGS